MEEPAFTIRIPKRWLQFRLRSLLLLMLGMAVALVLYVKRPTPAAMEGYCPVTLVNANKWIPGDPRYTAAYRGATYHFAGLTEQDQFMRDRRKFAPVMGCGDVVVAKKSGNVLPGFRRYGFRYQGRLFLFSEAASANDFKANPGQYVQFADEWDRAHDDE